MKKFLRILVSLFGLMIGYELTALAILLLSLQGLIKLRITSQPVLYYGILICGALIGGIIFYVLTPGLINWIKKLSWHFEKILQKIQVNDMILGSIGLILGLIIANLISSPFNRIPYVGYIISIVLDVFLAYVGIEVFTKKKDEILGFITATKRNREKIYKESGMVPKLLDTSVIIDGRIYDICKTGFIEGPIIVPSFILEELRHIADSSDTLKRNRGRRGLDILNRMQKELDIHVDIFEKDFDDIAEVDNRLLKLAQILKGKVITNDYNLNKVAEFQGVSVLNINELSNAVKSVVLPGEEMEVQIIKEGKETGQGVAYLDDGTMIVIENGKKHLGESVTVLVTSVLQTAAGRMIFARLKANVQEKAI